MSDCFYKHHEVIYDTIIVERIKKLFKEYALEQAVRYIPGESIAFQRNGSVYELFYEEGKLSWVEITAV